ncbi:MAG: hypothetical protein CMJ94_09410 [Planctomycetes bacterium]|nr:hypothetical protein [Planctomycetota bacterium]
MTELQSHRPRGLVAQAKAQPGKTATLGILVLMMGVVWGRALIGGEDAKKSKAKPSTAASAPASTTAAGKPNSSSKASTAKAPVVPQGNIKNFATAIARLETWRRPLGIEKAEPITEAYLMARRDEAEQQRRERWERTNAAREAGARALADGGDGILSLPDGSSPASATPPEAESSAPIISEAPLLVEEDLEVDLTLSGTLVLGESRFALFGDRRVQEGERFGRYLLKAVRPREVDLIVDGKLTVVRIAPPELGDDS